MTPRSSVWRILRALLLGLLLTPLCAYWAQDQGVDRIFSLMVPPVGILIVLVLLNALTRKLSPRFALSAGELAIIYAMLSVACAMASEWMDVIGGQVYSYALYADRNPRYGESILPFVTKWLFFKDAAPLRDFGNGGKNFAFFLSELPLWWPKVFAWTLLLGLVATAMLAINSLMRDQWIHREKLAFPVVQLPLALIQEGGASPLWRSRLLWIGFAATFGIDLLNGFAFLYPSLPTINIRFLANLSEYFPSPPWNQTGWTPIGIFPFISALGFFMPTDLLFSLLFFFFARKAQQIVAYSIGYEQGVFGGGGLVPSAPYFSEQSWGAFLGLFVSALWLAKPHLQEVWRQIETGKDTGNGISHRIALALLILSVLGLGLIGIEMGLSFVFVVFYTLLFLAFSVAMTRIRAQLGAPTHEMAFMGPNQLIVDFHGTAGLQPDFVTRMVTGFHFMNRIHRTHPMPSQLEGMYLAERTGMSGRAMFVALLIATFVGCAAGHLTHIWLGYRWTPGDDGGDTAGVVSTLTGLPRAPNPTAMLSVGIGFAFVLLLDFVRFRVPGFWLHPAGYALSMNFGVDYYWFGLLIVLIIKVFVTRYYGLRGYEKLRHVALGLILGEFAAELLWATFSMLNDRQATYSISINGKFGWQQ